MTTPPAPIAARGRRPGRRPSPLPKEELARRIGVRIREARLAHEWTQQELARAIRAYPEEVAKYERGKRTPSVETLRQLCRVLGASADRLLDLPAVRTPEEETP